MWALCLLACAPAVDVRLTFSGHSETERVVGNGFQSNEGEKRVAADSERRVYSAVDTRGRIHRKLRIETPASVQAGESVNLQAQENISVYFALLDETSACDFTWRSPDCYRARGGTVTVEGTDPPTFRFTDVRMEKGNRAFVMDGRGVWRP